VEPRTATSDLAALVAAENRFDRLLEEARAEAAATLDAARQRVAAAASELAARIASEQARVAAEIDDFASAEIAAIAERTRLAVERYDAVHGPALDALADRIAALLVEEAP